MKGNMPINLIIVMLIAVISITLMLGMFTTKVPNFAKGIYCKTFFFLHSATFVPDGIRQDQTYCDDVSRVRVAYFNTSANPDEKHEDLLALILACWEQSDFGASNKDIVCYELSNPDTTTSTFNKGTISTIIANEDICGIFPVPPSCPNGDYLEMSTITLSENTNALIEYDYRAPPQQSVIRVS